MPKTAFENIEALKRHVCSDRRTDGQTDGLIIPIKEFHPLIHLLIILNYPFATSLYPLIWFISFYFTSETRDYNHIILAL
jgi:hypothetical protein